MDNQLEELVLGASGSGQGPAQAPGAPLRRPEGLALGVSRELGIQQPCCWSWKQAFITDTPREEWVSLGVGGVELWSQSHNGQRRFQARRDGRD